MAFLEFLLAAAWAGVVTADVFQGVAHRLLMFVVAVWAMYMSMVVLMVVMVVVAVWAVDVGMLGHGGHSGIKSPGIISPLRDMCTLRPKNQPVFTAPVRR